MSEVPGELLEKAGEVLRRFGRIVNVSSNAVRKGVTTQ